MLRLCYVVVVSLPFIIYYVCKAHIIEHRGGSFSEERRYRMARRCIRIMMRHGRIETESTGQEFLPKEGGYVMYSNHQGKFDTLGIMISHPKPCTIVMDYNRSQLPIVDAFIDLVNGKRLNKSDMKSQVKTILEIADEVKKGSEKQGEEFSDSADKAGDQLSKDTKELSNELNDKIQKDL